MADEIIQVTAGYRITVPKKAREKLSIKLGDFVIAKLEGKALRIVPASVLPKK